MFAIVTGASSGIGLEICKILVEKYDLIIVSRNLDKLNEFKNNYKNKNIIVEALDLTKKESYSYLYDKYKNFEIDVLVNNAGFGKIGILDELDLTIGQNMIELNAIALYSLTHLFIKVVKSHILNVSSLAAFMPGPKMANYYATKSYVLSFSRAVNYELKKKNKRLRITTLCPGPVKTNFNKVAKGDFKMKGLDPQIVAKKAIKGMEKNKEIVFPSFNNKLLAVLSKLCIHRLALGIVYRNQNSK